MLRQYDPRRSHTDVTAAHYARVGELGPGGADAARRPVHVAARRHPRQGRQDDHGELAGAAGAVPGPRGVRRGVRPAAASAKIAEGTTKLALRQALDGIVPPHVLHRRKLGFPVPIRHWLRDEMYDWARGIVRDSQADHLVDLAAVTRMLDAHRAGPIDHSRRIWTLLVFLLWHGIFVEQRIRPEIPEPAYPVRI